MTQQQYIIKMSFSIDIMPKGPIRANTVKAGPKWILLPMDLTSAELIFMIERRWI